MKSGDEVKICIGGEEFDTTIDDHGVQRFNRNSLFCYLVDSGIVDLNKLAEAYAQGKFTQRDYMLFNMGLGYSVTGFKGLSAFEDVEVENPLNTKA